jgi:hypothetical protein
MHIKTAMTAPSTISALSTRLLDFIQTNQSGSSADPELFQELALSLFALQFGSIPVYRRFCESRGATPDRISDWRDIPAIPARAFKEFELSSIPKGQRTRTFLSSGTTWDERSRHFHSPESLRVYEASLIPWFAAHVLESKGAAEGLQVLVLTPTADDAPHSSLVHMFDTVVRTFQFAATRFVGRMDSAEETWSLDLPLAIETLGEAVEQGRPVLMLGTAFSYIHLADAMAGKGCRCLLPQGSRAMETGGYKGRSRTVSKTELHRLIEDRLGIQPDQIVSEYGMSELSSQAYDHVAGKASPNVFGARPHAPIARGASDRTFHFPPWARVQVISPETGHEVEEGETGLVRVLDLANVYSIASVQTEDLAVRRGSGFQLLGRAVAAEPRGCSLMVGSR